MANADLLFQQLCQQTLQCWRRELPVTEGRRWIQILGDQLAAATSFSPHSLLPTLCSCRHATSPQSRVTEISSNDKSITHYLPMVGSAGSPANFFMYRYLFRQRGMKMKLRRLLWTSRTSYNPAISIKSLEETDESIAVNSYQFNSLLITNMPKFSQVFVVVYFQLHL